jgi:hypothetical protein
MKALTSRTLRAVSGTLLAGLAILAGNTSSRAAAVTTLHAFAGPSTDGANPNKR